MGDDAPGARRSFDRVADVYDRTRGLPPEATAAVTAGIAGVLRAAVDSPCVLDVGVGTGRIAGPLAEAGIRVVGVDIAPAMLARARARRVPVAVADAAALPFGPARFDGALFVHLLHLVPDPAAVLRAAFAVVRPGGVVLVGRTNYAGSLLARAHLLVWHTVEELGGPRRPADWNALATAALTAVAGERGAVLDERVVARWTERATGRRLLDDLEHRVYSSTWAISDALMSTLLATLAPRAAALFGDLDRPAETEVSFSLVVARLPRDDDAAL